MTHGPEVSPRSTGAGGIHPITKPGSSGETSNDRFAFEWTDAQEEDTQHSVGNGSSDLAQLENPEVPGWEMQIADYLREESTKEEVGILEMEKPARRKRGLLIQEDLILGSIAETDAHYRGA